MRKLLFLFILVSTFTGCRYMNPSIMLKTDKDYKYAEYKTSDTTQSKDYKISPNDLVEFRIYTNDGFKLVDLTAVTNTGSPQSLREERTYPVEFDGTIKLPVIGRTVVQGLTIRQAELLLEDKFDPYYNDPFILLEVINKRAIIFPGEAGAAKVVPLGNNTNTTLIEALALAGGLSDDGKAWKIKVIRGYGSKEPKVFLIDLSTIEGISKAGMVLQANDIIYVEPRRRIGREVLTEITPIVSIITSLLIAYGLILRTSD